MRHLTVPGAVMALVVAVVLAYTALHFVLGCGAPFTADGSPREASTSDGPAVDVLEDADPRHDSSSESSPDVDSSPADAGADASEGSHSLCCHIDCNGDADLACDSAGVSCFDAGCLFYQACSGEVVSCP